MTSINIIFAAILGYSIVQLLLLTNSSSIISTPQKNSQKLQSQVPQPQLSKSTINVSPLIAANLFGISNDLPITTQNKNAPPNTKLNLKLQGIYYSSSQQISRVMITDKPDNSVIYHVGQPLPGDVVLHKIYPKKVILLKNGQYETLHLMDTQEMVGNEINEQRTRSEQKVRKGKNSTKPEKLLGHYQHLLQTNPNRLMKLVRIFPVNKGDHFIGYRIKPGKNTTLLSQFNLQSGDILTNVNGVKISSPLKGLSIIQQLATADQIDLEVLRQGQVVSLSFAVEK